MFHFKGALPASKSWMNRALVIQHFNPHLQIVGSADSEDVQVLKKSLSDLRKTNQFYLGQGGTSLRFFSFLVSRYQGEWVLKAHPRLLERPQQQLKDILQQLGVKIEVTKEHIKINSLGWKNSEPIQCNGSVSSQFISGLLLSSWGLDFDLILQIKKPIVSEDYLRMTLDLLMKAGLKYELKTEGDNLVITIPKKQKSPVQWLHSELDVSSAFSLCAAAVVNGDVCITNWDASSTQPDMAFLDIFKKMNIVYESAASELRIKKHDSWQGCRAHLGSSPDLFPVLAVLSALAKGHSQLDGAEQLQFKESDRLQKTKELLDLCGFANQIIPGGLSIQGDSSKKSKAEVMTFNPDHDHRMAMAAGVLKLAGFNISIQTPEVVEKSYPQFWKDTGVQP